MRALFSVIAVTIVAVGLLSLETKNNQGAVVAHTDVPFAELAKGAHAKVAERVNYLITSEEGLKELWKLLENGEKLPTVDFSQESVVAVFSGEHATGGYDISVIKVEDSEERMVSLKLSAPGGGCVVTQAISAPYQVIKIPSTNLPLTHADSSVTTNCSE